MLARLTMRLQPTPSSPLKESGAAGLTGGTFFCAPWKHRDSTARTDEGQLQAAASLGEQGNPVNEGHATHYKTKEHGTTLQIKITVKPRARGLCARPAGVPLFCEREYLPLNQHQKIERALYPLKLL